MANEIDPPFPEGGSDEKELLLSWLGYLRGAVLRKLSGLSEADAHTRPGGRLISPIGVVNHLTHVEWRWIDGAMRGEATSREESEFSPGPELTVAAAEAAYRQRATDTDVAVRDMALAARTNRGHDTDLRWVLLHLINETARHAGHADAARELIDGMTGE